MKTNCSSSLEILEARVAPSVFVVTSLADPAEAGKVTLRDALLMADNHAGPDTIVFMLPAPVLPDTNTIKLTAGPLFSKGSVAIQGPGASKLILDGNDASTILRIDDLDPTTDGSATISRLSFVHGKGSDGGGVFSRESLTLKKVVIAGSFATAGGGGLMVFGPTSAGAAPIKANISGSQITGNEAGSDGGGMALVNVSAVAIKKSVVTGNSAPNGIGGGFYAGILPTGGSLAITGCKIAGNSAEVGGGLFLQNSNLNPASKITISKTKVTGNTSFGTGEGGGGVYLAQGHAVITDSKIRNNAAVFNGGGIDAKGVASLRISSSTISGNLTTTDVPYGSDPYVGGGGLCVKGSGAGIVPVKLIDTRFTDNSSKQHGGGVFARGGIALTISSATFSGNHANFSGGGVFASGTGTGKVDLTVTSSAFIENFASAGGGISAGGSGVISINASKVTGNVGGFGGGIHASTSASLTIKNAVVTGNIAGAGGGVAIVETPDFKIVGGAIKGNSASYGGGGIEAYGSTGSITAVTISGNTAGRIGGGIFNSGNGAANIGTLTIQIAKVIANIAPVDPNVSGPMDKFIFV